MKGVDGALYLHRYTWATMSRRGDTCLINTAVGSISFVPWRYCGGKNDCEAKDDESALLHL